MDIRYMNAKKYLSKFKKAGDLYIKIVLTIIAISLVALGIIMAKQTGFNGFNQVQKLPEASKSATVLIPTSTISLVPTSAPVITSAPVNPHAGMRELKGTSCSGQNSNGGNINLDCQPYDIWVPIITGGSNSGVGVPHPVQLNGWNANMP